MQLFNTLLKTLNTYRVTRISVYKQNYVFLDINSSKEISDFVLAIGNIKDLNSINSESIIGYNLDEGKYTPTLFRGVQLITLTAYGISRFNDSFARFYFNFVENKFDIELNSDTSFGDPTFGTNVLNKDIHDSLKKIIIDNINLVTQDLD